MALFHTTVLDNQIKALDTIGTASGAICTFDTDMTENLVSCVCEVASGASEINVVACGKNLINADSLYEPYKQADGSFQGSAQTLGFIKINIPSELVGKSLKARALFKIISGATNLRLAVDIGGNKINGNFINSIDYTESKISFIPISTNDYLFVDYSSGGTMNFKDLVLYDSDNGTTYNIQLGEILSGDGTFDVLSGILTRSDNTTKQLNANYIQANNGTNNVYCDTGDTEVNYIMTVGKAIS